MLATSQDSAEFSDMVQFDLDHNEISISKILQEIPSMN